MLPNPIKALSSILTNRFSNNEKACQAPNQRVSPNPKFNSCTNPKKNNIVEAVKKNPSSKYNLVGA